MCLTQCLAQVGNANPLNSTVRSGPVWSLESCPSPPGMFTILLGPWQPGKGMESCLKQLEVPEMPPDRTGSEPMATRFPLGLRPREREGAVGGPATLGTGPRREGRNRSSRGGTEQS